MDLNALLQSNSLAGFAVGIFLAIAGWWIKNRVSPVTPTPSPNTDPAPAPAPLMSKLEMALDFIRKFLLAKAAVSTASSESVVSPMGPMVGASLPPPRDIDHEAAMLAMQLVKSLNL